MNTLFKEVARTLSRLIAGTLVVAFVIGCDQVAVPSGEEAVVVDGDEDVVVDGEEAVVEALVTAWAVPGTDAAVRDDARSFALRGTLSRALAQTVEHPELAVVLSRDAPDSENFTVKLVPRTPPENE